MSSEKKIDFIGIGAAKSGSSWLNNILLQHPSINVPSRKELTYFNKFDISGVENKVSENGLDYYLSFWDFSNPNKIRGEFSPQYLNDDSAPNRIKEHFPEVKLIVILRDPVHRALSHFEYDQHFNAIIPKGISVKNAIKQYPYLLDSGLYAKHLKKWFNQFSKEQIKVIIFEEAIENPLQTSQDLFQFIGLDCPANLDFSAVNERKEIKSTTFSKILRFPGKMDKKMETIKGWKTVKQSGFYRSLLDAKTYLVDKNAQKREKSEFGPSIYQLLNNYYREPNKELETLLGAKLTHWK